MISTTFVWKENKNKNNAELLMSKAIFLYILLPYKGHISYKKIISGEDVKFMRFSQQWSSKEKKSNDDNNNNNNTYNTYNVTTNMDLSLYKVYKKLYV